MEVPYQKSIRSLTFRYGIPNYRIAEYPNFSNLFSLHLSGTMYDHRLDWVNSSKLPQLRYLVIEGLVFPFHEIDLNSLYAHIEQSTIYDAPQMLIEKACHGKSETVAANREIQLVNSLLDSCPHLLAFNYIYSGRIKEFTLRDDTKSTRSKESIREDLTRPVLRIPSHIEWLFLQDITESAWIDLSQCKFIAGLSAKS
ncbi:hypothetical protein RFI_02093 [Reticulomyxa filosa]|uniref:Uncharacterized protein n=1 Tax=Reticulomyxa filosa TaxID=46433 RepID=X6PBE4_RETFI|nr:hypothetical protein RFI_02093 [Reticulomyxa filosa]|eukprot:ETO34982.1 hypothetical protein RFI_02093 [Reticulomyxa filosa]